MLEGARSRAAGWLSVLCSPAIPVPCSWFLVLCIIVQDFTNLGGAPVTTDTRWTDVDKMLQPIPKNRQELRERVIQDVAQARFEFPTVDLPSLRAFVNVPEKTMPIKDTDGNELVPDIVVVDTPGNLLKMLAQIETSEMITEEQAKNVWAPFAKLPDAAFYLYVPVGCGGAAKKLCKKLKIDVYGFRTWRYIPSGIEINDISEPPEVMVSLMPPIVRKMLRGV
jgi:hypothetical protein